MRKLINLLGLMAALVVGVSTASQAANDCCKPDAACCKPGASCCPK